LHDRTWPFRSGGNGVPGVEGMTTNFAFAVTLQNTFNAYRCINEVDHGSYDFRAYCNDLAQKLLQYSHNLP
jgi:hypothetical protein